MRMDSILKFETKLAYDIAPDGVTINNSARFSAIVGTLSNVADGSSFTAGNNAFQANYEGGDGNDLTLTVVP